MKIRAVEADDFSAWLPLWESYNTFYKRTVPTEVTRKTWERFLAAGEPLHALVAEENGQILGLAHFLFHRNTSLLNDICYLQDLFTVESARGRGVARTLIQSVYEKAKERGSIRVYWQTHESNEVAKALYDQVAERSGFVVYRKQL